METLRTKGERDIVRSLMRDLSAELFDSGVLRRISPWVARSEHLKNIYEPSRKDSVSAVDANIVCAGVLSLPLFPNKETGDADFARLIFVHVRELKAELMDGLIAFATGLKTRALSNTGWAGNIRDTDVIVIADTMEKGANYTFAQRARVRSENGNRGTMVFSSKQPVSVIRKHLYEILAKWLGARAEALQSAVESKGLKLFGKLEECVDYVRELGTALLHLAERILLPVRFIHRVRPPSPEEAKAEMEALTKATAEKSGGKGEVKWRGTKAVKVSS